MSTIADRRARVLLALGNRTDLSAITAPSVPSRLDQWISDSYTEIGMGYNFSEAELTFNGQVVQSQDSLAYPDDARAILSIMFYRQSDGTPVQPQVKDIQTIRQYSSTTKGPPSQLAYFALKVFMRPVPDQTYNYTLDFWQKPQIDNQAGDLGATELLVPDDWLEIIDYGAMMRGHAELQEPEKAQNLQNLLYGVLDPISGKTVGGLMAARMTRRQAQAPVMDYGIGPKQAQRGYGSTK